MNWSWLLPAGKGIPVLMYHKVWPGRNDDLTISPERLREQWMYLKGEGYTTLSIGEYLEIAKGQKQAPRKAVLITFDDGYRNNLTYAYPLLKELGWNATFFIITNSIEGVTEPVDHEAEQKMTPEELKSLDPATVQLGMHGYAHRNLGKIGIEEMERELTNSVNAFSNSGLQFAKVFAYPYGGRPSDKETLNKVKELMTASGIEAAFRIGNRVSKVPAPDIFEIRRIDIRGTDTISTFKTKLAKGKLKPF